MQFKRKTKKENESSKKIPFDVLPIVSVFEVAKALQSGNDLNGYKKHDWSDGRKYSIYYNACHRHIKDFWAGNTLDKKSRVHVLAHAIACLLILLYYELKPSKYKRFDDRVL